jgi:hypothetical protein
MVDIITNPPPEDPNRNKSGGELLFDRTVYTGIGFGLNEAMSLWITDQFMYGKNLLGKIPGLKNTGAWFSEEGYNRLSDKIAEAFKMGEKIAEDGSKISPRARGGNALLMVTLLSGGTLLILPMKWLEDSKNYWVKKANHMLDSWKGNKLSAEEITARDAEVEQHIACSPRQSWPSMMLGRVIACCSSVATGTFLVGAKNNERLMDWSEKTFTGHIQPEGKKGTFNRYMRLLSVETYSCAISSFVLETMSKLLSKRSPDVHDPQICHQATATAAASSNGTKEGTQGCDDKKTGNYCAKIQAQKNQVATLQHIHA